MHLQVRPIDHWRGEETSPRRDHPFSRDTTYGRSLSLLDRELRQLRAETPVLLIDVTERDCRLDGSIRADARPRSPRVVLAFDSKHGPLRYQCDTFHDWRANVRAVALALEALRKVDRYGVGGAGEQYRGWAQLEAGRSSVEDAAALLIEAADAWDVAPEEVVRNTEMINGLFRSAAKRLHPDAGGDPGEFERLTAARDLLASVS